MLQFPDRPGQRGLVNVQSLGRTGEMEFLGNSHETTEVSKFHTHSHEDFISNQDISRLA